jgi:hypothetical protein
LGEEDAVANRVRRGEAALFAVAALVVVMAGCGGTGPAAAGTFRDPSSAGDPGTPSSPASPSSPVTPSDPSVPPSTPSVVVAFTDTVPTGTLEPVTHATIAQTESLYVVADWKDAPAGLTAIVVIVSPEGTAYLQQMVPLADGSSGLVSVTTLADGVRRVVAKLPVWGTTIESYQRTGIWNASVSLQGTEVSGTAQLDLQ